MTQTRFVAVRFQSNSTRRYTYRDENEVPLKVGDKGDVETDRGIITVEVVAVDLPEPSFATRPIAHFTPPAGAELGPATIDASPPAEPEPRPVRKGATKKEVRELAADISRGASGAPGGEDQQ